MSYLLFLKLSWATLLPGAFTITEYSTKESCETALNIAKGQWATVNEKSYCISVKDYNEQVKIKEEISKLKEKLK